MLSCGVVCSAFYVPLVDVKIIYGIKYRMFLIKGYFVHLFVLFVCTITPGL
jgi:hypothetical protein